MSLTTIDSIDLAIVRGGQRATPTAARRSTAPLGRVSRAAPSSRVRVPDISLELQKDIRAARGIPQISGWDGEIVSNPNYGYRAWP